MNGWVENGAEWSESSVRTTVLAAWSAIPQPIRDAFVVALPGTNRGLRIYLGSAQPIYALTTGPQNWNGLTLSSGVAGDAAPRILALLPGSGDGTPWWVLVHEFGHYVDATYHRLWGKDLADGSTNNLTGMGPLSGLIDEAFYAWTAWQAAAPISNPLKGVSLYGFTNRWEWFAEVFRYWLVDYGLDHSFPGNQAGALLALSGMDLSRQQRIHDAIKALLPVMPPMPGL